MTFRNCSADTVKLSWVRARTDRQIRQGILSESDLMPTIRAEFKRNYVGEINL